MRQPWPIRVAIFCGLAIGPCGLLADRFESHIPFYFATAFALVAFAMMFTGFVREQTGLEEPQPLPRSQVIAAFVFIAVLLAFIVFRAIVLL